MDLLSEFPEIDFWDRPAARMMLSRHWPDDATLIDIALKAVRRGGAWRDQFERESAMHRCSPTNPTVADWVRQELKQQHPFSFTHDDLWDCVAPFTIEHPDIRASVIACVRSEFGRHSLHHFQSLIVKLGGDELRDELIWDSSCRSTFRKVLGRSTVAGRLGPLGSYRGVMDEIALWDDKKLDNLSAILPQILTDFDACRTRLLSLARGSKPRFDLIARGLAALGCTGGTRRSSIRSWPLSARALLYSIQA
jgi:hypothetical protein